MIDFQQKRKIRSVAYHKATLIILSILVLIFAHSVWGVYQKKRESEEMKNISLQNTKELRLRDEDLKMKIERLGTQTGVEEEIRSKFNVVKDGEKIVVIVEDQSSGLSASSSVTGFWQKIWDFFIADVERAK